MKIIELKCNQCGELFNKELKEYKRQTKKGINHFFCTRSCSVKHSTNLRISRGERMGNTEHLKRGSEVDAFSPFRYFLWKIRSRHKALGFDITDITLEYLKTLWEEQQGVCPLSGWNMHLPASQTEWAQKRVKSNTASLDRIHPKQPYVIGNVRFVSHIANMAKFCYSDEEVIAFCKAVAHKHIK